MPFSGFSQVIALPNASIPAGDYFLVQTNYNPGVGSDLPVPNFVSSAINMGATNGNVILVNGTTPLAGTCPPSNDASVVDRVAWGTGTCREGTAVRIITVKHYLSIKNHSWTGH